VEKPATGEKPVQVFVTSHSPNFASLADIDSIGCVYHTPEATAAFFPREVEFEKRKKEKLQRYVAITRAENLLIVAVPNTASKAVIQSLESKGCLPWPT
jgi:putative ATP-dependent endonuclease of OLD family